tara:strand:+ start:570 stop:824 length:255 start_codon:yes stop_codon:yes gene_type:complete
MRDINIWTDAEAYNGRGTKGEWEQVYSTTEVNLGPENKRDIPCDTCSMMGLCMEKGTECSAMRNWTTGGDYKDADVQRLVRAMQ